MVSGRTTDLGMFDTRRWEYGEAAPGRSTGYLTDQEPTLADVLGLLQHGKNYFSAFHANCRLVDDYYFNEQELGGGAEGGYYVNPPSAYERIENATARVTVENISISVPPPSARATARAEKLEKFYEGVWASIKAPVLRESVRDCFAYGVAFRKIQWAADEWPEAPALADYDTEEQFREAMSEFMDRRGIAFPIKVANVHPTKSIWDDSPVGMGWFIEFYQAPTAEIQWQFPEWTAYGEKGLTTWVEFWNRKYYCYIAGNQWIQAPREHNYGFLPYTKVNPSGTLGGYQGMPERKYRGIILPIRSLIDAEQRYATRQDAIFDRYAYPTPVFSNPVVQHAQEDADQFSGFGEVIVKRGQTELALLDPPNIPPDTYQLMAQNRAMMEAATFQSVTTGAPTQGVSSGFDRAIQSGQGARRFQSTVDGIARSVEEDNAKFAQIVVNKARGPLTVHGRREAESFDQTIGPNDIRGLTESIVRLKAEAPEERERSALMAIRLHQAGLTSGLTSRRIADIPNPVEEELLISDEQLLAHPVVQEALAQLTAQRIGLQNQQILDEQAGQEGQPPGVVNRGNLFDALGAGNQRVGEFDIQGRRSATQQGRPSVFPRGIDELATLGALSGGGPGGRVNTPNGRTV